MWNRASVGPALTGSILETFLYCKNWETDFEQECQETLIQEEKQKVLILLLQFYNRLEKLHNNPNSFF